jgi:hypothetical protein
MLLTSFVFFVRNLRKSKHLLIFAEMFAIFCILSQAIYAKYEKDFRKK